MTETEPILEDEFDVEMDGPCSFNEESPPFNEAASQWMPVSVQWLSTFLGLVTVVVWFILALLPTFDAPGTFGHLLVAWLPAVAFLLFGLPMAVGFLSKPAPAIGWVGLIMGLVCPALFAYAGAKVLIVYLTAAYGLFVLRFFFFYIDSAGYGNAPAAMMWLELFVTSPLFGTLQALLYLGQVHWHWSPKIRYFLIPGVVSCLTGVAIIKQILSPAPHDPEAIATYTINNVQYIRLNAIRIMMYFFMFCCIARALDSVLLPMDEVYPVVNATLVAR